MEHAWNWLEFETKITIKKSSWNSFTSNNKTLSLLLVLWLRIHPPARLKCYKLWKGCRLFGQVFLLIPKLRTFWFTESTTLLPPGRTGTTLITPNSWLDWVEMLQSEHIWREPSLGKLVQFYQTFRCLAFSRGAWLVDGWGKDRYELFYYTNT